MTVLLVANSKGVRRCNANCHDALGLECDCVCGGLFHGSAFISNFSYHVRERLPHLAIELSRVEGNDVRVFLPPVPKDLPL